jgi:Xaa-Pro aminopeptidase
MIEMSEYKSRRKKLQATIGKQGIVILPAAHEIIRNGDAHFPFCQNSDFFYMTGFGEPQAIAIIAPDHALGEFILFNRIRDKDREIWDGPRVGQEQACSIYGANKAYPIEEFAAQLPDLLLGRDIIHCPIGLYQWFDSIILNTVHELKTRVRAGVKVPLTITDITPTIHEMRLFKSPSEIATMKKAVDITAKAHIHAMQSCKVGMYEYELEASVLYEFYKHGSRFPAYTSIVGSGENSCILHYNANDKIIAANDLVLIDAGCELNHYAADITRTFPANGRFNKEQQAIYELVLASQEAALATIVPGARWDDMQQAIINVISQGLLDLGILQGSLTDIIASKAYYPFYMHRSGHWLGLDVHDVGLYKLNNDWRQLEPGMVFTVEPGIYISSMHKNIDARWHHIGVRIEDNVVVTKNGYQVLSDAIPKTVVDIEALMNK